MNCTHLQKVIKKCSFILMQVYRWMPKAEYKLRYLISESRILYSELYLYINRELKMHSDLQITYTSLGYDTYIYVASLRSFKSFINKHCVHSAQLYYLVNLIIHVHFWNFYMHIPWWYVYWTCIMPKYIKRSKKWSFYPLIQ